MNKNNIIKLLLLLAVMLYVSCSDTAGSGSSTGNAFVAGIVRPDSTSDDSVFIVSLVPENYLPYDKDLGELIQKDTIGPNEEFVFAIDSNYVYNVHVEGEETSAFRRGQDTMLVRGKTIKDEYVMKPHGAIKIVTDTGFTKVDEVITFEGLHITREISDTVHESDSTISFIVKGIPESNYPGIFLTEDDESQIFVDESFYVSSNDTILVTNIKAKGVMTPINSGLPNSTVYTMAIDDWDRILFGTETGVIGIYDNFGWQYIDIRRYGIFSRIVDLVFDEDSSLWCSTELGLLHFNGGKIKYYHTQNSGLLSDRIYGIAIDSSGDRWFSTLGGGVTRLSSDDEWKTYTTDNSSIPSDMVLRIRMDKHDNVWAISNHGVAKFNGEDWDVYNKSVNSKFTCDTISALAFDEENAWFASVDGTIVRKNKYGWSHYTRWNSPLKGSPIYALYIDKRGILWAANSNGEIYAFKDGKWEVYNCYNSCVPSDTGRMISIVEDNNGSLWVATEKAGVIEFAVQGVATGTK